jgi:hypothetical protein
MIHIMPFYDGGLMGGVQCLVAWGAKLLTEKKTGKTQIC